MKFEPIRKKFIRGNPGHVISAEYFYFETGPGYKRDLAIVCGGWEKCGSDYEVIRKSYPYYVIKYTLSGNGTFLRAGRQLPLASNTLCGFGPRDPHTFRADPQSPMEHIFIIFTGSKARQVFEQSTVAQRSAFKVDAPAESTYLLKSLFKTACAKPPYAQEICSAYLIALLLSQAQSKPLQNEQTNAFNTFLYCKKFIDINFLHCTSINSVAEECNLNIRYMARLFRKYASMRPHEYIMRLRLNKAADLLLNSSMNIVDIAAVCGFEDPYHFSKAFKKFHNLAPKPYRNLHIK
jgi:AraC-like DNA-binding protein